VFSDRGKTKDSILGGLILGLAILTRHNLLLFPVFLLILMMIFRYQKVYMKNFLVFIATCYLVLVPWNIRNYICFKKFIPVAMGIGGPFWMGSYITHQGEYRYGESLQKMKDEAGEVQNLADKEKNLIIKAFKNIRNNPVAYSLTFFKKFIYYFLKIYEDVPKGAPRHPNLFVVLILGFSYYPIFFLFLAGVILSIKRWKKLLPLYGVILYSGLIYSIFIVVPRYRIPLMPFFTLFAAFALITWVDRFKNRTIIKA
jgi:4-amino-4-deoxy-L-arabinose transferase-like glycosyltransferase